MNGIIKQIIEHELFFLNPTKREKKILQLREKDKTLRLIGLKLNLTQERVRQIEEKAMEKAKYKKKVVEELNKRINKYLKK